ncbi:nucleosidase [Gordonia hankookensis]|uniref:Nucleosidase n=1 Tax=Gordonia hankookensis TaxID=589403 RepID=A0ABR7W7D0_9ACTN|nr:nucleosidase [Gordonia hankookensis]MBD1318510.1 nucleosidase [Gordonia hankookensis]
MTIDPGTLVVAATRAEARYVPTGTRVLITGIGKVRAATALTRLLAAVGGDAPVRQIVNVGTAGALHDHHSGIFQPSTVIEHDISSTELRSMGYPVVDRWEMPDGDGTVLASGDTFVADPVRRATLAARADLVDMEGCAIAHVSAEFGVPCRMVKVVSDGADEGAMDWPSLVDDAARRLGEWFETVSPA